MNNYFFHQQLEIISRKSTRNEWNILRKQRSEKRSCLSKITVPKRFDYDFLEPPKTQTHAFMLHQRSLGKILGGITWESLAAFWCGVTKYFILHLHKTEFWRGLRLQVVLIQPEAFYEEICFALQT